jgi:hypothetical protein
MKTLFLLFLITFTSCGSSDKYKAQIIASGERFWVYTDHLYETGDTIQVYRDNYSWNLSTYWDNRGDKLSYADDNYHREFAIIIGSELD